MKFWIGRGHSSNGGNYTFSRKKFTRSIYGYYDEDGRRTLCADEDTMFSLFDIKLKPGSQAQFEIRRVIR